MGTQKEASAYKRILAFDLLRGFFMAAIIVDHINWGPSVYHLLSGGGALWVSPAEGFFAISGILVGYIYGPRLKKSFKSATKKLWKRAWLLYSLSIVFTLTYTVIALYSHSNAVPPIWQRDGVSFIYNVLLARYSYGWTDFLPRYAVFMFVAPFLLWLITRGKAWIVAGMSVGVWALFHTTPLLLPFSSWELIFIPAMIAGYYLPTIELTVRQLPTKLRETLAFTLWSIAGMSFVTLVIIQILLPMFGAHNLLTPFTQSSQMLFDKETVGIGRFLLGVVWFWAFYSLIRRYEHSINRVTRGVFETVGKKSLYTYGIHGFVIFIITLLITPPTGVTILQSTVFSTIILCVIYVAVISPTLAKWLDYEYHKYLVSRVLGYNQAL